MWNISKVTNNDIRKNVTITFLVNFEQISHNFVELPLLTFNKQIFAGLFTFKEKKLTF